MMTGIFSVAGLMGDGKPNSWNNPRAAVIAASGIVEA